MEGWNDYIGKKVFIELKNGRKYSGKVLEIKNKGSFSIVMILDKFGHKVGFYDTEISVMEEEKNEK